MILDASCWFLGKYLMLDSGYWRNVIRSLPSLAYLELGTGIRLDAR